jgi:hypothetical protein
MKFPTTAICKNPNFVVKSLLESPPFTHAWMFSESQITVSSCETLTSMAALDLNHPSLPKSQAVPEIVRTYAVDDLRNDPHQETMSSEM